MFSHIFLSSSKTFFFPFQGNIWGCIYAKISGKLSKHIMRSISQYCWCLIPCQGIGFLTVEKFEMCELSGSAKRCMSPNHLESLINNQVTIKLYQFP